MSENVELHKSKGDSVTLYHNISLNRFSFISLVKFRADDVELPNATKLRKSNDGAKRVVAILVLK